MKERARIWLALAVHTLIFTCAAVVVQCSSSDSHAVSKQLDAGDKQWFRNKVRFHNHIVPKHVKDALQSAIPEVTMQSWDVICTDARQKHPKSQKSRNIVKPYAHLFLRSHPDAGQVAHTLYNHHSSAFGQGARLALQSSQRICSNMHLAHPRNAFMRAKAVAVNQYLNYGVNKHDVNGSSNANELFNGPSPRPQP